MPIVHFIFWAETIDRWVQEGYVLPEPGKYITDDFPNETAIAKNCVLT
ncbi:hypothetical protein [Ructibacterium gallinarum]|nr:hypothetical protein [Ructibacterium gallinarum]